LGRERLGDVIISARIETSGSAVRNPASSGRLPDSQEVVRMMVVAMRSLRGMGMKAFIVD
jgi:hypothetical protein